MAAARARKAAPLRAVKAGEKPPAKKAAAKKPLTVSQAAAAGNQRALLVAMQTRLALAVENLNTPPRDLAALTRRLHEVTRDLAALDEIEDREDGIGEAAATPDEEFEQELTADDL